MNQHGDQRLEHLLQVFFAPDAGAALAERIAAAWQRGERGSGVPPSARTGPPAGTGRPTPRSIRWLLAAGVAAVCVGLGLYTWWPGGAVRCAPPAWVVDPAQTAMDLRGEIRPGESVLAWRGAGTRWRGPEGSTTELAPDALVRRGDLGLELHRGTLTQVQGFGPAVTLRALDAVITPAPATELELCLHEPSPQSSNPEDPIMNLNQIRDRIAGRGLLPVALTVTVFSGSAEIVTAQGRQTVPAATSRRIVRPGAAAEDVWRQELRDAFAAAQKPMPELDPSDEKQKVALERDMALADRLASVLLAHPSGLALIRAELHRKLGIAVADKATEAPPQLLDALILDPSPEAAALAGRLLQRNPPVGDIDFRIAFAERGNAAAARALREEFARHQAEFERSGDDSREFAVAVFLGLRRDGLGRQLLVDSVKVDHVEVPFMRRLECCGRALRALGDDKPFQDYRRLLRGEVERLLREGQLPEAGQLVAIAEYFEQNPIDGRGGSLALVERRAQVWHEQRAAALGSADAIRRVLDRLAPK